MSEKLTRHSLAPRLIEAMSPVSSTSRTSPSLDQSLPSTVRQRRLSSRTLLGEGTSLVIDHEGVTYVLRATRLGKLILTK